MGTLSLTLRFLRKKRDRVLSELASVQKRFLVTLEQATSANGVGFYGTPYKHHPKQIRRVFFIHEFCRRPIRACRTDTEPYSKRYALVKNHKKRSPQIFDNVFFGTRRLSLTSQRLSLGVRRDLATDRIL